MRKIKRYNDPNRLGMKGGSIIWYPDLVAKAMLSTLLVKNIYRKLAYCLVG